MYCAELLDTMATIFIVSVVFLAQRGCDFDNDRMTKVQKDLASQIENANLSQKAKGC